MHSRGCTSLCRTTCRPAIYRFVASASNTNLIPNANLVVGQVVTPDGIDWFLNVTPASNQVGTTTITLTAMNDAGLSTNESIVVTVDLPLPLDGPVFPDTNLTSWVTGGEARGLVKRTFPMRVPRRPRAAASQTTETHGCKPLLSARGF